MRLGRLIFASSAIILSLWGDMELENPGSIEEFAMEKLKACNPPEMPWGNPCNGSRKNQTFLKRTPPRAQPESPSPSDVALPTGRPCPIPSPGGVNMRRGLFDLAIQNVGLRIRWKVVRSHECGHPVSGS